MIGSSAFLLILLLLLLSPVYISANPKSACESSKLPRECQCLRPRGVSSLFNETRMKCRQLTEITTDYRWSNVHYDRLSFETPLDNLTVNRFAFADVIVRTLRFNTRHLFLSDRTFENAYIGQLVVSHFNTFGTIEFESNGQMFRGTTITNIYFKQIDFQRPIAEITFAGAKILTFLIQSSKFYGFTNQINSTKQTNTTSYQSLSSIKNMTINENQNIDHDSFDTFLEYERFTTISSSSFQNNSSATANLKKKRRKKKPRTTSESSDDSSILPEETVQINITLIQVPVFVAVFSIVSSIDTPILTQIYFPINFDYSQTDEIELIDNHIDSLGAHAFRHLYQFEGRLTLINNNLTRIDPLAFVDLPSLSNLSLARNNLNNISSIHLKPLIHLYELDLSHNQIRTLHNRSFEYLSNLHILRLSYNPIESIDSDTFSNLTQLKEISLEGVQLVELLEKNFDWLWSLASVRVINLLNMNYDLSDVAFCILSRFNQTLFHLPRQHPCSCNVHYLYRNHDFLQNTIFPTHPAAKYNPSYLRLTPTCIQNYTESIMGQYQNDSEDPQRQQLQQYSNTSELLLRGLEDKCDYKLMFLDCNAMTTTTKQTTTLELTTTSEIIDNKSTIPHKLIVEETTETPILTTTPWWSKYTKPPKKPVNNTKKLFTVLATLLAITIGAIFLVILWYRLKAMFKRRQKKKKVSQQQRHFSSATNNNHTTAPRYASSDMLSSIHSAHLAGGKNSQSQALIASALPPPATVYKNVDALINEPIQVYIDDASQRSETEEPMQNRMAETHAITEC